MIQNTLLAQYYTTLHNYCTEEGIPSPTPLAQDIVGEWDRDFKRIKEEVESINTIARGKAVHAPMELGDDAASRRGSSLPGLNLRNGLSVRKSDAQNTQNTQNSLPSLGRLGGKFSAGVSRISPSGRTPASSQSLESHREHDESGADRYSPSANSSTTSYSPAGPVRDYFQGQDSQSVMAAKKKAPPPPPKRIQSSNEQWVTALYTFAGQESNDLAFQEGDRIRVLKRTDSTDDWWDGELRGVRGRFPANYVEL